MNVLELNVNVKVDVICFIPLMLLPKTGRQKHLMIVKEGNDRTEHTHSERLGLLVRQRRTPVTVQPKTFQ